jgi:hypothetical protein
VFATGATLAGWGCCWLRRERLDRDAFLQELRSGEDDAISRFEPGDDGINISDRLTEIDGSLVSEESAFGIGSGDVHK